MMVHTGAADAIAFECPRGLQAVVHLHLFSHRLTAQSDRVHCVYMPASTRETYEALPNVTPAQEALLIESGNQPRIV